MPNRYPHFMGGSQKCTQGAPPLKARNCKSMKMLNCILAWNSVPAARTMQTAVYTNAKNRGQDQTPNSSRTIWVVVPHAAIAIIVNSYSCEFDFFVGLVVVN